MRRLLKVYGITGIRLAKILNCSNGTAYLRLAHPEKLTIEELRLISRRGGVPMEEILREI